MKNRFITKGIAVATLMAMGSTAVYAEEQRYIIKYKDGFGASVKSNVLANGGKNQTSLDRRNMVAAKLSQKALEQMQNNPNVEYVEVDPIRRLMAESTPYGITMVQANQVSDDMVSNRKVCIVDTGYDLGHEDLISSGVTGDDGYGSNDTGNWYNDGHGHGTHVAGTISALGGNNKGVVGVSDNGQLQLHIVKVFNDSGSWAYGSDLIAAVDQCVAAGSNIISMSLGGSGSSNAEKNAFDQALANGVLSIAAAGNDGNSSKSYPASYDSVVSVGAVDSNKNIASFSQYNDQVEISAPGVAVNSTLPNNSYDAWSGTSMATPHVSGVAAVVWSHHTQCTAAQIRNALNVTSEDRGSPGRDNYYGYGIVKSKAALDALDAQGCDVTGGDNPPPPGGNELVNGETVANLSGGAAEELNYTFAVPADATNISFEMSGGSGDADLYVKFGSAPTTSSYDCRPYAWGNNETCSGTSTNGTYYVMIRGYSSFSGVSIKASYQQGGGSTPDNELQNGVPVSNLSGSRNEELSFTMPVPAGASNIQFQINGGSGDADLYVKYGSAPTTSDYDCRPYASGNNESCAGSSSGGTYYVMLRGYRAFSGVTLTGSYTGTSSVDAPSNGLMVAKSHLASVGFSELTWSGINGNAVDIYRNGMLRETTDNSGQWRDRVGGNPSGHFSYKVCEQGTDNCTEIKRVLF